MDAAGHPALLLVDTISSLGSIDFRHDEWGVDVTVGCSQKGLMLPRRARLQRGQREGAGRARATRALPRSYWDWEPILEANRAGFWPYTSATNLLYGLREALAMLQRGGAASRLRAPPPPRRGDARGGRRLGPRGAVRATSASTRRR